jgi:hypothetical protein
MNLTRPSLSNADGSINQASTRRLFRLIRIENGLSLRLVAKQIGISKTFLYELERGRCRWHDQLIADAWQAMEELIEGGKQTRLSKSQVLLVRDLYEEGVMPTRISYETGIELSTVKGIIYFGNYKKFNGSKSTSDIYEVTV